MMKDNDIYGAGNAFTTQFREIDARLGGRWWSIDPKAKAYESPYVGFSDNPIHFSDPAGDDPPQNNASKKEGASAAEKGPPGSVAKKSQGSLKSTKATNNNNVTDPNKINPGQKATTPGTGAAPNKSETPASNSKINAGGAAAATENAPTTALVSGGHEPYMSASQHEGCEIYSHVEYKFGLTAGGVGVKTPFGSIDASIGEFEWASYGNTPNNGWSGSYMGSDNGGYMYTQWGFNATVGAKGFGVPFVQAGYGYYQGPGDNTPRRGGAPYVIILGQTLTTPKKDSILNQWELGFGAGIFGAHATATEVWDSTVYWHR